jgi:hypothetical protein
LKGSQGTPSAQSVQSCPSANFRKHASHKQSANRARISANIAGSTRTVAHQHPASCLHRNTFPHRAHFFST